MESAFDVTEWTKPLCRTPMRTFRLPNPRRPFITNLSSASIRDNRSPVDPFTNWLITDYFYEDDVGKWPSRYIHLTKFKFRIARHSAGCRRFRVVFFGFYVRY